METKVCKQCGGAKTLDQFKEYAKRGTGQRHTNTGRYTICKTCERLGIDVQYMLNNGMYGSDFDGLSKIFAQPGWTPVLKPIRQALGIVDQKPASSSRQDRINNIIGGKIDEFKDM